MLKFLIFGLTFLSLTHIAFCKAVYVDDSATGNNSGSNWKNACTDLQNALSKAKTGDEIWVAEGIYTPGNASKDYFKMIAGVSLYGGFKGTELLQNQRNPLAYKSVLSGEIGTSSKTDNISRILVVSGLTTPIVISGFTISMGYGNDFIASGVEIASSSPVFSWCTFENNENSGSFASGGAVTITGFNGESKPQFVNCIFRNNTSNMLGGAVHSNDNNNNVSQYVNCLFDGNKAVRGGALHNGSGVISTYNCTFVNNTADKGSTSYATGGTATQHINAIIWDNNNSPVMNISSSVTTIVKYSIIRGGYTGNGNMNKDPRFTANNNYTLSAMSPARNAGDPSIDPADLPAQDLAGGNRMTFGKLDIGAYEYQCQVQGSTFTAVTCDKYISNSGKTYTLTGTYTEKFATKDGCDSIVTLNLTITKAAHTISETACELFEINGKSYTKSGTYVQTLKNSKGCDSVLTIELTIHNVNVGVVQSGKTLTAQATGASYQWIDCDDANKPLDGETGKSFTATKDGNYAVEVIQNSCNGVSDCFALKPSGLETAVKFNFSLYPNPFKNEVQLINEGNDVLNFEIFTVHGILVRAGEIGVGNHTIQLNDLIKGIYIFKAQYQTVRILKE